MGKFFKSSGTLAATALLAVSSLLAACDSGTAATSTPAGAAATSAPTTAATTAAATATSGTGATGATATTGTGGTSSGKKLKVGLVTDVGSINDKNFNQASYEGVQRAEKELGAD